MIQRSLTLPFLLMVAFAACSDASAVRTDALAEEAERALRSAAVPEGGILTDGDSLAAPSAAAVHAGKLILIDNRSDRPIRLIDVRDGSWWGAFGREGGGPGEFSGAWSIDPVPNTPEFDIYDVNQARLTRVSLEAAGAPAPRLVSTRNLVASSIVLGPVSTPAGRVAIGAFGRDRLGVFDARGELTRSFAPLPPEATGAPEPVLHHAYQSWLAPNPDRTRLALATRHADRLDIYSPDGRHLASAERPLGFEPNFGVREGGRGPVMASDDDLRFGYIGLATTAQRIYALFSGYARSERPGYANFGESVYVYDWDGRLHGRYRLPRPAITIAADAASDLIYAVYHDPEPHIGWYRIP
ncbi:MAG: BF3164 family lipoprotein [Longimicrobiales bacterium]